MIMGYWLIRLSAWVCKDAVASFDSQLLEHIIFAIGFSWDPLAYVMVPVP